MMTQAEIDGRDDREDQLMSNADHALHMRKQEARWAKAVKEALEEPLTVQELIRAMDRIETKMKQQAKRTVVNLATAFVLGLYFGFLVTMLSYQQGWLEVEPKMTAPGQPVILEP